MSCERVSGDTMVNSVQIGEIRTTLNSRIDEISEQQMVINGECDLVQGEPLTTPQAEKLAASDYVVGEDNQLDKQARDLKIKCDKLGQDEKSIIAYGKENGFDKTMWRHAPEMFKGEGLKYYESSIATIANNKKFFDRQATEIQAKGGQLQDRLQTPEARLAIAKKSEEYLAKDRERLAKLARLNSKLNELKKEQSDIRELRNVIPSRKLEREINLQGDAQNVQNLLGQTDQIKQQVLEMQQTMVRTSRQGRSLHFLLK